MVRTVEIKKCRRTSLTLKKFRQHASRCAASPSRRASKHEPLPKFRVNPRAIGPDYIQDGHRTLIVITLWSSMESSSNEGAMSCPLALQEIYVAAKIVQCRSYGPLLWAPFSDSLRGHVSTITNNLQNRGPQFRAL